MAIVAAPASAQQASTVTPAYPMASLYVGDLHPDVTEAMLFEKFSVAGPVMSIRVCRDAISRRSLGYAYVNFQQPADAERALDTMNFDSVMNKPIRIMWSQRDPALRRSGVGNIFIKNLDKTIDNKAIHDTFSMFGSILSCKVAHDDKEGSLGYGFVHFETEESALQAIEKVNGMLLNGKKVFVGRFLPRVARFGDGVKKFTNVYVKNVGEDMDEEKLKKMFEKFGEIQSCIVAMDTKTGKSRGFGFLSYKTPEEAEAACAEMNGTELKGDPPLKMFVGRAQKKLERQAELRRQHETIKNERYQRFQGANLYVKNIEESVDEEQLTAAFNKFGPLNSVKIMRDEPNRSKGFGFVCFTDPEHAAKAIAEMNNTMLKNKPLYVALAQRKEDRKSHLAALYMQRLAAARMNPSALPGKMYTPAIGRHFVAPSMVPSAFGQQTAGTYGGQSMGYLQQMQPPTATQAPPSTQWGQLQMQQQQQQQPTYVQPVRLPSVYGSAPQAITTGNIMQQQYLASTQQQQQTPMQSRQMAPTPPPVTSLPPQRPRIGNIGTFSQQPSQQLPRARVITAGGSTQQQQTTIGGHLPSVQGVEPLTTAKLASMNTKDQKQTLGDRIFPYVSKICPAEAGKVTGMLLEMDNEELLMMLDNEALMASKVKEALTVLRQNKAAA